MNTKEKIKVLQKTADDLRLGMPAEHRAADYYAGLAEKAGFENYRERLMRLAEEEREHLEELRALVEDMEDEISRLSSRSR